MRYLTTLTLSLFFTLLLDAQTVIVYDLEGNLDFPTWRDWSTDQDGNIYGLWSAPVSGVNKYTLSRYDEGEWNKQEFIMDCDNCLRSLDQHPDGSLWAGTTEGVYSLQNGTWQAEQGINTSIRYLDIAPDGTVWFVDFSGLKKSENGTITEYLDINGTATSAITNLLVDQEGQVYFVQGGSLFRFAGGTLEDFDGQAVGVVDIALDANNHLWAALSFNYLVDIFEDNLSVVDNNFISPSGTAGFTAFTIDAAGRFWVATQGGNPKLIRWDGGTETIEFDISEEFGDFLLVDYIYASPDNRKWLGGNFKEKIVEIQDGPSAARSRDLPTLSLQTTNPVQNNQAVIHFELPMSSKVQAQLFDEQGRLLQQKSFGLLAAGSQQLVFELENLAAGTYSLQLRAEKYRGVARLVVLTP